MAGKIVRITQQPFGTSGPVGDFGAFGSKAVNPSAPIFTQNPVTIQSLAPFSEGWGQAIIGDYEPPLEDMNGLFLLTFYQLGYILEMGLAEYDSGTVYFLNSMCQYNGVIYQSLINNNQGNEPDISQSSWQCIDANAFGGTVASSSSLTLPNTGNCFKISGTTNINNISIWPAGATVELVFTGILTVNTGGNILLNSGSFITSANSSLTLFSDGSNWFELARSPAVAGFGLPVSLNWNQVYGPTATDGFVVAYAQVNQGNVYGYSNSNSNPSSQTPIQISLAPNPNSYASLSFPVQKGNYYEVQATSPSNPVANFFSIGA